MIPLLSGIWDIRPHITVDVVSTKDISLVCFDEEHTFQGGMQNSKESVWKARG